jgi:hypothetical protein
VFIDFVERPRSKKVCFGLSPGRSFVHGCFDKRLSALSYPREKELPLRAVAPSVQIGLARVGHLEFGLGVAEQPVGAVEATVVLG